MWRNGCQDCLLLLWEGGWTDASSVTTGECVRTCEWVTNKNPFQWLDAGPHPGHNAAAKEQQGLVRHITHAVTSGAQSACVTIKRVFELPVFPSYRSARRACQNKPRCLCDEVKVNGKPGLNTPRQHGDTWKQSVCSWSRNSLESAAKVQGEYPGRTWRICVMWVCECVLRELYAS